MSTIYTTSGDDLTSIANAIRTKGGTSASLSYPTDFITAINNIRTGGGVTSITANTEIVGNCEYIDANGVPQQKSGFTLNESLLVASKSLIVIAASAPQLPVEDNNYFLHATYSRTYSFTGRNSVYIYYFQAD